MWLRWSNPWSEVLGAQQDARSKVAENISPFLWGPVGTTGECQGVMILIGEAVWHRSKGVVSLWGHPDWVQIPPLLLPGLYAFEKSLMVLRPQFSHM